MASCPAFSAISTISFFLWNAALSIIIVDFGHNFEMTLNSVPVQFALSATMRFGV